MAAIRMLLSPQDLAAPSFRPRDSTVGPSFGWWVFRSVAEDVPAFSNRACGLGYAARVCAASGCRLYRGPRSTLQVSSEDQTNHVSFVIVDVDVTSATGLATIANAFFLPLLFSRFAGENRGGVFPLLIHTSAWCLCFLSHRPCSAGRFPASAPSSCRPSFFLLMALKRVSPPLAMLGFSSYSRIWLYCIFSLFPKTPCTSMDL